MLKGADSILACPKIAGANSPIFKIAGADSPRAPVLNRPVNDVIQRDTLFQPMIAQLVNVDVQSVTTNEMNLKSVCYVTH